MAVIRHLLGERDDQFFATVFIGSGIAFGLLAITAAVCAATRFSMRRSAPSTQGSGASTRRRVRCGVDPETR